jgi:hypothetical protein
MEVIFLKRPCIFLATLLKPCIEIWKVVLNFGQIMPIENL